MFANLAERVRIICCKLLRRRMIANGVSLELSTAREMPSNQSRVVKQNPGRPLSALRSSLRPPALPSFLLTCSASPCFSLTHPRTAQPSQLTTGWSLTSTFVEPRQSLSPFAPQLLSRASSALAPYSHAAWRIPNYPR